MKAPTTLFDRPGRIAAVVGAVVAVSATTLMAFVAGSAAASVPGRCTDNVNVRATPDPTARIVALCERGQAVQVGETRNGFVRLADLGGWSSAEYVSVDGEAPAASSPRAPGASSATTAPRSTTTTRAPGARSTAAPTAAPTTAPTTPRSGDAAGDGAAAPTTQARVAPRGPDSEESAAPTTRPSAPRSAPEPEPAPGPAGGLLG